MYLLVPEDGRELVQFSHIVEEEYILRVCPCGSTGWIKSRDRHHQKYCECKNEVFGRPHCSPLFQIEQGDSNIIPIFKRAEEGDSNIIPIFKRVEQGDSNIIPIFKRQGEVKYYSNL
jgi:hypothetical protein